MAVEQLTRNFTREEFRCPCGCRRAGADYILLLMLEQLRARVAIEVPDDPALHISSGFRCVEHNRAVGGLRDSFHPEARAADVFHDTMPVQRLHELAVTLWPKRFGIGYYPARHFIHLDSGPYLHPRRGSIRRWER